jgi:putative spermidine/putrescine transport system permease protein
LTVAQAPAAGYPTRPRGALEEAPAAAGRSRSRAFRRRLLDYLGVVPFFAYLAIFLAVPTVTIAWNAFLDDHGHFTLSNISASLHGVWLLGYEQSLQLAAISAGIAAVVGMLATVALGASREDGFLRRFATTGSGVFANTGGIPLAFSFVATLGLTGIITKILTDIGFNPYDHGFSLYTMTGIVIVYLYFLIPVMVLVMLPPVDALRREWYEAASNLGAKRWQYWRYIGIPVLWSPFLAAFLLLFVDAFAAYATAEALSGGFIALTPIQIGSLLNGNVLANEGNLGDALGLGMIVVIIVVAAAYVFLQRRAARWLR